MNDQAEDDHRVIKFLNKETIPNENISHEEHPQIPQQKQKYIIPEEIKPTLDVVHQPKVELDKLDMFKYRKTPRPTQNDLPFANKPHDYVALRNRNKGLHNPADQITDVNSNGHKDVVKNEPPVHGPTAIGGKVQLDPNCEKYIGKISYVNPEIRKLINEEMARFERLKEGRKLTNESSKALNHKQVPSTNQYLGRGFEKPKVPLRSKDQVTKEVEKNANDNAQGRKFVRQPDPTVLQSRQKRLIINQDVEALNQRIQLLNQRMDNLIANNNRLLDEIEAKDTAYTSRQQSIQENSKIFLI